MLKLLAPSHHSHNRWQLYAFDHGGDVIESNATVTITGEARCWQFVEDIL